MILNKKITVRLDEFEEEFLRNKSKEMKCSITILLSRHLTNTILQKHLKLVKIENKKNGGCINYGYRA